MGILKKTPTIIAKIARNIVSEIWLLKANCAFGLLLLPNALETILPPRYRWTFQLKRKEKEIEILQK